MANLQEFCLRWNNHNTVLTGVFAELLKCETFFDCTLVSSEGRSLEVHRILLSACSPYFRDILSQHKKKEPIIILKDVKFRELSVLVDYMYYGEVNIRENELQDILKVAESLRIKGLSDTGENAPPPDDTRPQKRSMQSAPTVPHSSFSSEHGQSYQSDLHSNDSSRHSDDSPAPAKRGRRRRPSNESALLHSQTPSESPVTVASHSVSSAISHLPAVPALLTTAVNPLPITTVDVPAKIIPDTVAQTASKTELIEPKQEIEEINGDEDYEDLTQEDDDSMNMDNSQPGPSHGNDSSSSQGYPPWQMGSDGGANQDSLLAQAAAGGSQGAVAWSLPVVNPEALMVTMFSSCDRCHKRFHTLDHLIEHRSSCRGTVHVCEKCKETFKNKSFYTDHINFECGKGVACPNCNKQFKLKRSLTSHLKHDCGKYLNCSKCTKKFSYRCDLKRHETYECGKVLKCPKCCKVFTFKTQLNTHVKHECGKIFKCPTCFKVYKRLSGFSYHVRYECGKMPRFFCDLCEFASWRKDSLTKHIEKNHLRDKYD